MSRMRDYFKIIQNTMLKGHKHRCSQNTKIKNRKYDKNLENYYCELNLGEKKDENEFNRFGVFDYR